MMQSNPRYTVSEHADEVEISIPARGDRRSAEERAFLMFRAQCGPRVSRCVAQVFRFADVFVLAFLTLWLGIGLAFLIGGPLYFLSLPADHPQVVSFWHDVNRDLKEQPVTVIVGTLVYVILFGYAGKWAALSWLWMVNGREVITVVPACITIRREVFGFGRTRRFDSAEIDELGLVPSPDRFRL